LRSTNHDTISADSLVNVKFDAYVHYRLDKCNTDNDDKNRLKHAQKKKTKTFALTQRLAIRNLKYPCLIRLL
jgi:hypothetical protein